MLETKVEVDMDLVLVTNAALVGILIIGGVVGFAKGFLEQALEFLGVIVSFVVAVLLGGVLARFAAERLDVAYSPALAVVSIVLFFAGLMVSHLIARAIGRVVKMTLLGWVDRLAGALLGLFVAMILSSLLITMTLELPFPKSFQRDVQRSSVGLFLKPIAGQIFNFLVAHGPKAVRFEDIFKERDTI